MLLGREYVGVNRLLVRGGRSASVIGMGGGVVGGRGKFMDYLCLFAGGLLSLEGFLRANSGRCKRV